MHPAGAHSALHASQSTAALPRKPPAKPAKAKRCCFLNQLSEVELQKWNAVLQLNMHKFAGKKKLISRIMPHVKCFEKLDPFFPLDVLLWADVLSGNGPPMGVEQRHYLPFAASQGKEVRIACLKVGDAKPIHQWPHSITLRVNDQEFVVDRSAKHGNRRGIPFEIKNHLKTGVNSVEVKAFTCRNEKYIVAMLQCSSYPPSSMLADIKRNATVPFLTSTKKIKRFLRIPSSPSNDDVMCVSTSSRFKLTCPVTHARMTIAARGFACLHVQCYDVSGYLEVMRQTAPANRWKCPQCHLIVRPNDLRIDTYICHILETVDIRANEVEICQDGSWTVVDGQPPKDENEVICIDSPSRRRKRRSTLNCVPAAKRKRQSSCVENVL